MSTESTIFLRIDAPFSAWRWLQAGVYRATFPIIPPSAAWGLVLNLAGIETRGSLAEVVTPIRPDAPTLDIAVGEVRPGTKSTLYQQLHSYPVGTSGAKDLKTKTFGNKYWIAPARREVLVDLIAIVGARGPREIIERVPKGLAGELDVPRYGLPFAGDNQFLFSRIDIVPADTHARWYEPVVSDDARKTTRLTTNIDRVDASRTVAPLFAPGPLGPCPEVAWTRVGPAASA